MKRNKDGLAFRLVPSQDRRRAVERDVKKGEIRRWGGIFLTRKYEGEGDCYQERSSVLAKYLDG